MRAAPDRQRAPLQSTPTMAVVTSPSREISSSEPLKNENASVPQRENRAGVPSPWGGEAEGGALDQLSGSDGLKSQQLGEGLLVLLQRCCAVQALPGDREFETRLRTRGKAVLQGIHHLLGDGAAKMEGPCLERHGLALPGSSHLIRIITRSNNEFRT